MRYNIGSDFFRFASCIFHIECKRFLGENIYDDIRIAIAHKIEDLHVPVLGPIAAKLGIGKIKEGNGNHRSITKRLKGVQGAR